MDLKNKRGQVTIFIIVAVLIVVGVVLFFVLNQVSNQTKGDVNTEEIRTYVQSCMEGVGREVILQTGEGGGYYLAPENSTEAGIVYYLKDGRNLMPSKEEVEEEIAFYVSEKLFFCTENFRDFPEYNISQEDISSEVSIKRGRVEIETTYPLTISKGESTSRLKEFRVEIPSRLNAVYSSVNEFMDKDYSNGICISCLSEIASENDLYVDMFDLQEGNSTGTIFIFEDRHGKLNDETLEWVFANEYE